MKNQISFSSLKDYQTLQDLILEFGISKNKIKLFLDKKLRDRNIVSKQEISIPIDLINNNQINPNHQGPSYKIIDQDENFLAIHKPVASHSVSQHYTDTNTSSTWLAAHSMEKVLNININDFNRGLLNRLDYETSGVLVYCLKDSLYFQIRENFNQYIKVKNYICLVRGDFSNEKILINNLENFGPDSKKVRVGSDGKEAKLKAKKIKYDEKNKFSILLIELHTGLRHQIRAQLSHIGYPIIGDELYGGEKSDRLYLHAYQYEIEILGKRCVFKSDILEGSLFDLNRIF